MNTEREDSYRSRQRDEVEAMEAIFGDSQENFRKSEPKGPKKCYNLSITLYPHRGSSAGTTAKSIETIFLTLEIILPMKYPDNIPILNFSGSKGLSSNELAILKNDLNKLTNKNVGKEMLYQLCHYVQNFLYLHRKQATGSFHDEMIRRHKMHEEENMKIQHEIEEKQRLEIQEEILKKQEALKEESKIMREERKQREEFGSSSPEASLSTSPKKCNSSTYNSRALRKEACRRHRSTSEGSGDSSPEAYDVIPLEFKFHKLSKIFYRGYVLGRSMRGTTVYVGMDTRSGALTAITEWKFTFSCGKKKKDYKALTNTKEDTWKNLRSYENELNHLHKLQHINIVSYQGVRMEEESFDTITFCIAQEFVRGICVSAYLQGTLKMELAMVRNCAKGILQALEHLHDNDIVHRFLRDTSIFIDSNGEVKVSDYGIERKVTEFYTASSQLSEVSDKFSPTIGRGAKKGDIYRFGVILLSLLRGRHVNDHSPSPDSAFPDELKNFLDNCLNHNEGERWTARKLLEHPFIKTNLSKLPDQCDILENARKLSEEMVDQEKMEELTDLAILRTANDHSRLGSEFEILKWLGKGGFGDVLKVRNKLDGGIYALKRIKLNPKNKQLNRKITREVKLLSRLNHENVVRYFNSWIETLLDSPQSTDHSDKTDETQFTKTSIDLSSVNSKQKSPVVKNQPHKENANSLGLIDNIEDLAPPLQTAGTEGSDWGDSDSTSCDYSGTECTSDDDDDDLFGLSCIHIDDDEDSENVVFMGQKSVSKYEKEPRVDKDGYTNCDKKSAKISHNENGAESLSGMKSTSLSGVQYMYIQMEFCEKSTLRTAIDSGLSEDKERCWRLFREIVEGLVHIHQQGMIHRDLKPVNIFLDSSDHVKIGDFGLARTIIVSKQSGGTPAAEEIVTAGHEKALLAPLGTGKNFESGAGGEESFTGQVGTALYLAPELVSSEVQLISSEVQKVDIYSLGIIFFEMFYRPLETGMERIRILLNLRKPEIIIPPDFEDSPRLRKCDLLRWLLNHNVSDRPTSAEVLESEYLPPLQSGEAQLQETFTKTISNPQSKAYKYLMSSCFQQKPSKVDNITYDMDMHKPVTVENLMFCEKVRKIIKNVFERHGGVPLRAPLLMPKSTNSYGSETTVDLMCNNGSIVSLPHDLRVPFVRYISRTGTPYIKRYLVEHVYRERKVYGFHPRELTECAFDIIEPNEVNLVADAEVISIVADVLNELPWLRGKNCTIRLNHSSLIKGILLHYNVDAKKIDKLKMQLSYLKVDSSSKLEISAQLTKLGIPEGAINIILSMIDLGNDFHKFKNVLMGITKKKSEVGSFIKEALHELEVLIENLSSFGLMGNAYTVVINPLLCFAPNIYNGLTFQVAANVRKRKNKDLLDVIAAGGRYDDLIRKMRSSLEAAGMVSKDVTQRGVGISISIDKLISSFDSSSGSGPSSFNRIGSSEVLICSLRNHTFRREKISFMRKMIDCGVSTSILDSSENLETAEEYFHTVGADFLIIFKEHTIKNSVMIRTYEKGRFQERSFPENEAIDFILKHRKQSQDSAADSANSFGGAFSANKNGYEYNSRLSFSSGDSSSNLTSMISNIPFINISFVVPEKEKQANFKRRYESLIVHKITETVAKFSRQHIIEVLAVEVNSAVINTIASVLDFSNEKEYEIKFNEVVERHLKHKKYLKLIRDDLIDLKFHKCSPIIILYGLIDNFFRVIL